MAQFKGIGSKTEPRHWFYWTTFFTSAETAALLGLLRAKSHIMRRGAKKRATIFVIIPDETVPTREHKALRAILRTLFEPVRDGDEAAVWLGKKNYLR